MNSDLSLVPLSRFGALLSARRRSEEMELAEIARLSYGVFTVRELERIERGRVFLSDQRIFALSNLYELDCGSILPERKKLIVDPVLGRIDGGAQSIELEENSHDEILTKYISLVHLMRDVPLHKKVDFRKDDREVLAKVLHRNMSSIETSLQMISESYQKELLSWSTIFRKKLVVPGAGLFVAVTSVGSLMFVGNSPAEALAEEPSAPVTAPEVQKKVAISAISTDASVPQVVGEVSPRSTVGESEEAVETTSQTAVENQETTSTISETEAVEVSASTQEHSHSTTVPVATTEQEVLEESTTTVEETVETVTETALSPVEVAPPTTAAQAPSLQELGKQAESMIGYDWKSKLPGWEVSYLGDKAGYRGMTIISEKKIEIYVNPGDSSADIAEILAHELGHAIDVTYLTNAEREQWLEVRGMPAVWWAGDGLRDFDVGAGDFAEAVAALWVQSPSDATHGSFTAEQLQLAHQLIS